MKILIGLICIFCSIASIAQKAVPVYGAEASTGSSGGSVTVSFPIGHTTGDLVLLVFENAGGQQCPDIVSNGFTQLSVSPSQAIVSGIDGTTCSVYWKRCTSNAEASFASGDSGDHQIGRMILITGANKVGSPFGTTGNGNNTISSTSISTNSITTKTGNNLVLHFITGNYDGSNAKSGWTNANLSSLLEKYDSGTTSGNGGSIAIVSGTKATAGSVGSTTGTQTNSDINAFITVSILPESNFITIDGIDANAIQSINGINIDDISNYNGINKN